MIAKSVREPAAYVAAHREDDHTVRDRQESQRNAATDQTWVVLSYEVPHEGVSGFWESISMESETAEHEWESDNAPLDPALQPWCYAAKGDTLLPLWITEEKIRIVGGYHLGDPADGTVHKSLYLDLVSLKL